MHDRTPLDIATVIADHPYVVRVVIDRTGAVKAYTIPTDSYIGLANQNGVTVGYIRQGHITVTPRSRDHCRDLPGEDTSDSLERGGWDVYMDGVSKPQKRTRRAGVRTARAATRTVTRAVPRVVPVCGVCFVEVPTATNVCEDCG